MSVIIRERERERDRDRDWDSRTTHTHRDSSDRAGFTTVKRYRIPNRDEDDDRLSVYNRDRDRRTDRSTVGSGNFEETRIIRRERTPEPEPERREIRVERFERERPLRHLASIEISAYNATSGNGTLIHDSMRGIIGTNVRSRGLARIPTMSRDTPSPSNISLVRTHLNPSSSAKNLSRSSSKKPLGHLS